MCLPITPARRSHSKDDRGGRCWTLVLHPAPETAWLSRLPRWPAGTSPSRLSVQAVAALSTNLAHGPECV